MTYKDFELASINMHGAEAIKIILTGDIQKKLKKSARKKKWDTASLLPGDTFALDMGEYTVSLFCKRSLRLLD
jgi:hypothetical protein